MISFVDWMNRHPFICEILIPSIVSVVVTVIVYVALGW